MPGSTFVKELFQSLVTTRQKWTGADKEEQELIRPRPGWPEERNAKRAQAKIETIRRLTEAGLL